MVLLSYWLLPTGILKEAATSKIHHIGGEVSCEDFCLSHKTLLGKGISEHKEFIFHKLNHTAKPSTD